MKLATTGVPLRDAPSAVGPLGQVLNLVVTAGDNDGSLDVAWEGRNIVRNGKTTVREAKISVFEDKNRDFWRKALVLTPKQLVSAKNSALE